MPSVKAVNISLFFQGLTASLLSAVIGLLLLAMGYTSLGWGLMLMALIIAIIALACARHERYSGLAFLELKGDPSDDSSSRTQFHLQVSDRGSKKVEVGYVHWFAKTDKTDFTVGVGSGYTVFVAGHANRLTLKGVCKPGDPKTAALPHL